MKESKGLLIFFWLVFIFLGLEGNDGRDRYRFHGSSEFMLFPDVETDMVGYRVLKEDASGGADGERKFRWAQPQAIALVRIAAARTQMELGAATYPMAIFDCSAENGDTPIQFTTGQAPRGRHPGNSHDGGLNLDLGYYLNSLQGQQFSPDYAACTNHFQAAPDQANKKPEDANRCLGPADRLDTPRQTYFVLQLFRINREIFSGDLLEEIGIDWQVQQAVLEQTKQWIKAQKHGATTELLADMQLIFTANDFEGWSTYHHHHLHLRLRDLPLLGHYRPAFQKLFDLEKHLDQNALAKSNPATPALRSRLCSTGMQRYVKMEILNLPAPDQVRFRINDGTWILPDPTDWQNVAATIAAPARPAGQEKEIKIQAEYGFSGKNKKILALNKVFPGQDAFLFVTIDPSQIIAACKREVDRWLLDVQFPAIYQTLITRIYFDVYRQGEDQPMETLAITDSGHSLTLDEKPASPIRLILARILLSSRLTIKIPVYCHQPE